MLKYLNMSNSADSNVKVIFVPCYLDGKDGIVNMTYYDLVLGNDLSVYPSYYEPWGYTPLESVAFKVPTITSDLAGFGLWVNSVVGHNGELADGVKVIHRTDYNYSEVADAIKDTISEFSSLDQKQIEKNFRLWIRNKLRKYAKMLPLLLRRLYGSISLNIITRHTTLLCARRLPESRKVK